MKKIVSFCLVFIMMFSIITISAYAEDNVTVVSENIEYLDDGYYIVDTLTEEPVNSSVRATSTKSGSKTRTLYNSDDEALVALKLTGTFTYTGSSATCTASSVSYTIYNDQWKVTTATASKSGRVATGTFVAKHYVLLVVTQTMNETLTISCSNTGTLS